MMAMSSEQSIAISSRDEDLRVVTEIARLLATQHSQRQMLAEALKLLEEGLAMEETRRQMLESENLRLRNALKERFRPEDIIGNSHGMREVYLRINQVASTNMTVLIRGESGTGKELAASVIHYNSLQARKPFVKVNCAALSEGLLESELFGHEKGAFTGAFFSRAGRIEEAEGGTLFLDEIGDLSPAIQVKLLRLLQEREYERVGSDRTLKANVRILAATNRELENAVEKGLFREDLYYRINVFPIVLPPLRERKEDILLLADHFVATYARKLGKDVRRISTQAINMMAAYHWPGNVRELENCIEYAILLSRDSVIHGHNLPPTLQMPDADDNVQVDSLKHHVSILEKDMIVDALKSCHGSINAAARRLGVTARIVRYKIKKLRIDHQQFAAKPTATFSTRRPERPPPWTFRNGRFSSQRNRQTVTANPWQPHARCIPRHRFPLPRLSGS